MLDRLDIRGGVAFLHNLLFSGLAFVRAPATASLPARRPSRLVACVGGEAPPAPEP